VESSGQRVIAVEHFFYICVQNKTVVEIAKVLTFITFLSSTPERWA